LLHTILDDSSVVMFVGGLVFRSINKLCILVRSLVSLHLRTPWSTLDGIGKLISR
jgi:hypothetical protein